MISRDASGSVGTRATQKNLGNQVVSSTKISARVIGLHFQSVLMITEAPETCSHPGECVCYSDLSDGLPEWVPKLPDSCYLIPEKLYLIHH